MLTGAKFLTTLCIVTLSVSRYVLRQNISDFTQQPLTDADISSNGQYLFAKVSSDFYVFQLVDSNYKIYDIGTGWPATGKMSVSENTVDIGQAAWVQSKTDIRQLQTFPNCIYSAISKNGLVTGCFNSTAKTVYIASRTNSFNLFNIPAAISTLELPKDLFFNYDGSSVAIITSQKVYIFKKTLATYRIDSLFSHGLPNTNQTYVSASQDFSIVVARDNSTIKFFQSTKSSYQSYKTLNYTSAIVDWTFDRDHLVVALEPSQVRVLKKDGKDFTEVQNLAVYATAVGSSNGTLVTAGNLTISVWDSSV